MSSLTKKIVTFSVILIYLMAGIWFVMAQYQLFSISIGKQKILGYLFIAFSVIRGIMFYQKNRKSKKGGDMGKILTIGFLCLLLTNCSGNKKQNGKHLNTPTSGTVKVVADESLRPIIDAEIEAFEAIYQQAHIQITYLPEAEAVNAILNDSAKLAILTRALDTSEINAIKKQTIVPRSTLVGKGAICLITNKDNPDSVISLAQLQEIFSNKINTWSQVDSSDYSDSIQIIFANQNASTVKYVLDSISNGKLPKNVYALDSNGKVIDYVSANKNAMGIIGVSWISDKESKKVRGFLKKIRVMAVSKTGFDTAYKPYQAYIANNSYPLIRNIYFESREPRMGLATGFTSYVAGNKGQSVILRGGLIPATMPVRIVEFKK